MVDHAFVLSDTAARKIAGETLKMLRLDP